MAKKPKPTQRQASAVTLAVTVLRAPACLDVQQNQLLSICVWKWTEAYGKYTGCQFWTRAARAEKAAAKAAARRPKLIHEHVVPRKMIVEQLRALIEPREAAVRKLFEAKAVACIVTRKEHRDLPDVDWEALVQDPWARYHGASVEVVDTWDKAA